MEILIVLAVVVLGAGLVYLLISLGVFGAGLAEARHEADGDEEPFDRPGDMGRRTEQQ